ncbi:hypothetical protein ABDK00_009460 [Niabella insulamsoli]|uniref:hypothetical protein n=1 Tax=Niabella insulamsoli TaxID=3144874 RepID=UPI0031FCD10B
MKKYIVIFLITLVSCSQRIDMDLSQWGQRASLSNVQIFKLETDVNPNVYETAEKIGSIQGVRRVVVSRAATVDTTSSTVTIALTNPSESLDSAGFIFYHDAVRVDPMGGAPVGGQIGNLSSKQLVYRLQASDGTFREWKISIQ